MLFSGSYFAHRSDCHAKKRERIEKIDSLDAAYQTALTSLDEQILSTPLESLIGYVHKDEWEPLDILRAYGKKALAAHRDTNCLTEILIDDAEGWARAANKNGSLAGVPVSLKDTINVAGYDSCIGYSAWTNKPAAKDSAIVRLLKDAGAVPFVKTNIPTCLLSFESYNDVWGRTTNPHNKDYSPGGSSGGESALLAYGGSIVGVGSDVAGSVRVPAHFAGIYTIKCSTGRFPKSGIASSMPGQEGIKSCYSPMTRSLDSLSYFLKAVIDMKPWNYDSSCDPIPWRDVKLPEKLRIGVMNTDGVVRPTPACARALGLCVEALSRAGHQIVPFNPPSPANGLRIASQLLLADGGKSATRPFRWGERNELGLARMLRAMRLPRWVKRIWAGWCWLIGDTVWADLIRGWSEKTGEEQQLLVVEREQYKSAFFEAWQTQGIDFLLTVPNATPATPHNGLQHSFASCGYTFLFNLVDYPAGVMPVTKVDRHEDILSPMVKSLNAVEKGAYRNYDAEKMHGLPVGVQVVGRRLEEESVLKAMEVLQDALEKMGIKYEM